LKLPPDIKIHDIFYVSSSKPREEGDFKNPQKNRKLSAQQATDPDYEISRILDDDWKFGVQFYMVGFKGYSELYDDEWFHWSSLMKDAAKIVLSCEKAKHIDDENLTISLSARRYDGVNPRGNGTLCCNVYRWCCCSSVTLAMYLFFEIMAAGLVVYHFLKVRRYVHSSRQCVLAS
jgi:hypothetical protein